MDWTFYYKNLTIINTNNLVAFFLSILSQWHQHRILKITSISIFAKIFFFFFLFLCSFFFFFSFSLVKIHFVPFFRYDFEFQWLNITFDAFYHKMKQSKKYIIVFLRSEDRYFDLANLESHNFQFSRRLVS